jgi:deferrochelatase/peroxidase EfeB
MGRWPDGTPLIRSPHAPNGGLERDDVNDFLYGGDRHGDTCPLCSHVRRANPRDARGGSAADSFKVVNRHRILRRGRAYGPALAIDDAIAGRGREGRRGLLFISLQASIARGFELVQQTWNVNPGFLGLDDEPDPIAGPGQGAFSIPASPLRIRLAGLPRFVTVRGGGYLFLPSRAALERLGD